MWSTITEAKAMLPKNPIHPGGQAAWDLRQAERRRKAS
jgi:hypothetical protein